MTFRPPTLRRFFATLAALALFATACGGGSSDTAAVVDSTAGATEAPAQAPAEASLVATTVSGGQIDFGDLAGQDVVLWFWAPW